MSRPRGPPHAPRGSAGLDRVFAGGKATVVDGRPTELRIEAPDSLVEVVVRPTTADGVVDVPLHIGYAHRGNGTSGMCPNWMRHLGPVRFWFPPGEVELFVSAAGRDPVPRVITIAGDETEPIEVTLVDGG